MKTSIHMYLHQLQRGASKPSYHLTGAKFSDDEDWAFVKEIDVEVEVDDDFDPRQKKVAALEEKKIEIQAECQMQLTEIDRKISDLLAIEAPKVTSSPVDYDSIPF